MSDDVVVEVTCMEHVYPGGGRVAVCGREFLVRRGQRVAVLGPNGSGKSTLLKHVLGILHPKTGEVRVFGADPARQYGRIRARIGAVMQNVDEQLVGPTVFDDVAFAALNFGMPRQEAAARTEAILGDLGIAHLRDRLPHYLSGGERKKVALAGALVFGPELLVMDEPLESIDWASRREITRFLTEMHRRTGLTIISTTHDMEMVTHLADVGYVMRAGGGLELYGPLQDLFFEHNLSEYNIAPPEVVRIAKALRNAGVPVQPTLDPDHLAGQVVDLMRYRRAA